MWNVITNFKNKIYSLFTCLQREYLNQLLHVHPYIAYLIIASELSVSQAT